MNVLYFRLITLNIFLGFSHKFSVLTFGTFGDLKNVGVHISHQYYDPYLLIYKL